MELHSEKIQGQCITLITSNWIMRHSQKAPKSTWNDQYLN